MALSLAEPPEGGLEALGRALDHLGVPLPRTGADPAAGEALRPIPLYRVGEASFGEADPLEAARRIGWRYIVRDGEGPATVDITDEERPQVLRMRRGDSTKQLLRAAARAEAASDADEREVRILGFGRLPEETLWLAAPGADRFIPLAGGRGLGTTALLRRVRRRGRPGSWPEAALISAPGFEPDSGDAPVVSAPRASARHQA